jgi:hypothetical protein
MTWGRYYKEIEKMNLILTTGLLIKLGIPVVRDWRVLEPTLKGGMNMNLWLTAGLLIGLVVLWVVAKKKEKKK